MLEKEIKIKVTATSEGRLQGKTIEIFRKIKGWSQVQLAKELGVSRSTLQSWEREGVKKRVYLVAIASVLGVDVEALTGDRSK